MSDFVSREEIIPLLDRPKKVGSWVMSFCPAHSDQIRSLALSEKGVLECMTGCGFKEVITALRERGPGSPTMIQSPPNTHSGQKSSSIHLTHNSKLTNSEWEMIDLYEYRTMGGQLLAEKSRWHSRSQVTPDGKPVKKFLWRLPGKTDWGGLEGQYTTKDLPLYGEHRLVTE